MFLVHSGTVLEKSPVLSEKFVVYGVPLCAPVTVLVRMVQILRTRVGNVHVASGVGGARVLWVRPLEQICSHVCVEKYYW